MINRVTVLMLAVAMGLSLFSACSVRRCNISTATKYIAYTDNVSAEANTVFVTNYKTTNIMAKADAVIASNKYMVLDLSPAMETYYARIKRLGDKAQISTNYLKYTLFYTESILACYVDLPSSYGLTEAHILESIEYVKKYVDGVRYITKYSENLSADYLSHFDGVVYTDKAQLQTVPEGKSLWAMADAETAESLLVDDTEGVLITGNSVQML